MQIHHDQPSGHQVHEIKHPQGHGLMDTRRELHNRSPYTSTIPSVGADQDGDSQMPQQSY